MSCSFNYNLGYKYDPTQLRVEQSNCRIRALSILCQRSTVSLVERVQELFKAAHSKVNLTNHLSHSWYASCAEEHQAIHDSVWGELHLELGLYQLYLTQAAYEELSQLLLVDLHHPFGQPLWLLRYPVDAEELVAHYPNCIITYADILPSRIADLSDYSDIYAHTFACQDGVIQDTFNCLEADFSPTRAVRDVILPLPQRA